MIEALDQERIAIGAKPQLDHGYLNEDVGYGICSCSSFSEPVKPLFVLQVHHIWLEVFAPAAAHLPVNVVPQRSILEYLLF